MYVHAQVSTHVRVCSCVLGEGRSLHSDWIHTPQFTCALHTFVGMYYGAHNYTEEAMNNTIARSILFVVPRMAEDTNTNVAQCVQQRRKKKNDVYFVESGETDTNGGNRWK